jgi:hypothetical protein
VNEEYALPSVLNDHRRGGRQAGRQAGRRANICVNVNIPLPSIETAVSMTDGVALLLGLGFGRVLPPWAAEPCNSN